MPGTRTLLVAWPLLVLVLVRLLVLVARAARPRCTRAARGSHPRREPAARPACPGLPISSRTCRSHTRPRAVLPPCPPARRVRPSPSLLSGRVPSCEGSLRPAPSLWGGRRAIGGAGARLHGCPSSSMGSSPTAGIRRHWRPLPSDSAGRCFVGEPPRADTAMSACRPRVPRDGGQTDKGTLNAATGPANSRYPYITSSSYRHPLADTFMACRHHRLLPVHCSAALHALPKGHEAPAPSWQDEGTGGKLLPGTYLPTMDTEVKWRGRCGRPRPPCRSWSRHRPMLPSPLVPALAATGGYYGARLCCLGTS